MPKPTDIQVVFEYAIRKVQEANLALYIIENHQILAYAEDVNLTAAISEQ